MPPLLYDVYQSLNYHKKLDDSFLNNFVVAFFAKLSACISCNKIENSTYLKCK